MLIALLIFAAAVWVGLAITIAVVVARGIGIADEDRHATTFAAKPVRRIGARATSRHAA